MALGLHSISSSCLLQGKKKREIDWRLRAFKSLINNVFPQVGFPRPPIGRSSYAELAVGNLSLFSSIPYNSSILLTNRPLILGRLSASFLRQSYLMRFLQTRFLRVEWNLAMRALRASGR